jgi:uncharacterized protein YjbI with pentapeptide repeats
VYGHKPVISLEAANLNRAYLSGANLSNANLRGADLYGSDLSEAILSEAILIGAEVTKQQLAACRSLEGATMPEGRKYDEWFKDKEGCQEDGENPGPS